MESLSLRNHIALRAILSALQRPAIHRLHSTWGHVSCVCLALYEKLKTRDNWVHRKRLFKISESGNKCSSPSSSSSSSSSRGNTLQGEAEALGCKHCPLLGS
ncbi:Ral guanine nucleotide dissociation stimulator-like 3 [Manis javanica]|nr:Ral guanine nucleotide dissociation stimulator-like 3 [Manis javanica]KAI5928951.1 Ral guanine nucleotide dissociation stimulator-like 3 [Manis javanica]